MPRQGEKHENEFIKDNPAPTQFPEEIQMTTSNKSWSEMTRKSMTKAEFFQVAGITSELEEFVDEFIKKPEVLQSLSLERQQQIEAQMDAVLALFA